LRQREEPSEKYRKKEKMKAMSSRIKSHSSRQLTRPNWKKGSSKKRRNALKIKWKVRHPSFSQPINKTYSDV